MLMFCLIVFFILYHRLLRWILLYVESFSLCFRREGLDGFFSVGRGSFFFCSNSTRKIIVSRRSRSRSMVKLLKPRLRIGWVKVLLEEKGRWSEENHWIFFLFGSVQGVLMVALTSRVVSLISSLKRLLVLSMAIGPLKELQIHHHLLARK